MKQSSFDNYLTAYCNSELLGKYPEPMVYFIDSMAYILSGEKSIEKCIDELYEKRSDVEKVNMREVFLDIYLEGLIGAFSSFPEIKELIGIEDFYKDFQEYVGRYEESMQDFIDHIQNSDVFKDVIFDVVGRRDYERE